MAFPDFQLAYEDREECLITSVADTHLNAMRGTIAREVADPEKVEDMVSEVIARMLESLHLAPLLERAVGQDTTAARSAAASAGSGLFQLYR